MKQTTRWGIAVIVGAISVMSCILIASFASFTDGAVAANGTLTSTVWVDPPYIRREDPLVSGPTLTPTLTSTPTDALILTNTSTPTPTLQMLIPLYSYPNWYDPDTYIWDDVAAATCHVRVTAIINPNNGPGGCPPNSDYQHGLDTLRNAGVTILGYVDTNYGERPIDEVKAEVDLYDQCFDIDGIFFDQVASSADKCDYYQELYNYVKSKLNLAIVIINPGTAPDECYISRPCCDTANISEKSNWECPPPDSYVYTYPAERFSILVHSVPHTDTMKSYIDLAVDCNIGYVYLTDDTMPNPWDTLPKFWRAEVDYIASLDVCVTWLPLILCNH